MNWDVAQSLGVIIALVGVIIAVYKAGPERGKVKVDTVDVNVKIAGDLRDDAVEAWQGARKEFTDLRTEFDAYRKATDRQIADLIRELNTERDEKKTVKRENAHLIQRVAKAERRVTELEAEVKHLKEERAADG